jgi:hypothetical protein
MGVEIMEFSPLRRTAIRLACTHAEDREWILVRLEPVERQRIEALLEEINLLGLAVDPAVVAAVMAELAPDLSANQVLPENALVHAYVSGAEHPFWAGLVLQLHAQTQRRQVLDALPNGARVRRWDNTFAKQPVPPALAQCLKDYLVRLEVSDGRP